MGRKNTDHTTEASFRELVIRTSEMMYDTSRKRQSQDRIADLEVSRNNISELKPRIKAYYFEPKVKDNLQKGEQVKCWAC